MHKQSTSPQQGAGSHLGYLWLALGISFALFAANGRWDIALAGWLSPLFFLRFTRTSGTFRGFAGVWLASAGATLFALYGLDLLNPFVILVCLLFSTILTLPYLLDRLIAPRLSLVSGLLATLLFPLGRATCEYLISFTPGIGTVFSLAYTQYGNLPLLQMLSVTGVYGVSFLIAWFASVGNWVWEQHFVWARIRTVTLLYLGLLALVLLGGSIRLAFFSPSAQTVRVAGVSVPPSFHSLIPSAKHIAQLAQTNPAHLRSSFATYDKELLAESRTEAQAGAKIIVWPEVGAYTLAADKTSLLAQVQTLSREEHIYLDMGLAVFQPPATYYNQAILIDPKGQVVWTYEKAYPVPGDPEKPGDAVVPVVKTPYGILANVICFDADFPGLMRQGGSQGVDIMLVPSNDWQAIDPWHPQHATFRAIENGYSLVRPASNGLAMTVDYEGHTLAATDYFTTGQQAMIAFVPMKGVWTLYAHIGDLFVWLCIAGVLLLIGVGLFTSRKYGAASARRSQGLSPSSETEQWVKTPVRFWLTHFITPAVSAALQVGPAALLGCCAPQRQPLRAPLTGRSNFDRPVNGAPGLFSSRGLC